MKPDYCKRCKKLYNKIRSPYCGNCLDYIDEKFTVIRNYIDEHPKATIKEILEETKVEENILLHLIREERLTTINEPKISCIGCGKLIEKGKYCEDCNYRLNENLKYINKISKENIQNNKNISEDKKSNDKTQEKPKNKDRGIHITRE